MTPSQPREAVRAPELSGLLGSILNKDKGDGDSKKSVTVKDYQPDSKRTMKESDKINLADMFRPK